MSRSDPPECNSPRNSLARMNGTGKGRVVGVRLARRRVDQQVGVAVVGGNDPLSARALERGFDASQTAVHRFASLDGCGDNAGVSHHVAVREVDHNQIECSALDPRTTMPHTSAALISGWRSYVATLGEGAISRSSPS